MWEPQVQSKHPQYCMWGSQEAKKEVLCPTSSESLQHLNTAPINWSVLKDLIRGFPWHGQILCSCTWKEDDSYAMCSSRYRTSCHLTPRAPRIICWSCCLLKYLSHLLIAKAVSACQPSETRDFQMASSFGSSAQKPTTFRGEFSALFPLYSASQFLFQQKLPSSCVPCTTHYPQAAKVGHHKH